MIQREGSKIVKVKKKFFFFLFDHNKISLYQLGALIGVYLLGDISELNAFISVKVKTKQASIIINCNI